MGSFSWSDEQLKAINSRNNNYLVSAAAGSGKTTVLVERIIRRITDKENPVSVDRFLVMTFTNAAAAEMKERILNAIEKEVDEQPDNQYLLRQKVLVKNANIMTIDAFCLNMLRAHFEAADIDPYFEICDDADNKTIQNNVFKQLLDEHLHRYYNNDTIDETAFYAMLSKFGGKNGEKLFEYVDMINKEMDSRPFPNIWLENSLRVYSEVSEENFEECNWVQFLKEDTIRTLKNVLNRANSLMMFTESLPEGEALYKTASADVAGISELLEECDTASYDQMAEAISTFSFPRATTVKANTVDDETKEYFKSLRDAYKKSFDKLIDLFSLGRSNTIVAYMQSVAPEMKAFADFVIEFRTRYFSEKKKKNVFTFADIESMCLKILIKHDEMGNPILNGDVFEYTDIAMEYSKRFSEILVDEYQDSNDLQEVLINALASKDQGNIFMVGDVKQSIYRFRQSNPKLFLDKLNRYDEYVLQDEGDGSCGKKIMLDRNYRSASGVLEGINDIFTAIMKPESGEIDYDEKESLKAGRGLVNEDAPDIEVHIINHQEIKEEHEDATLEKAVIEAEIMTARVKELVEGNLAKGIEPMMVTEKDGTKRPAQYGDIAVLLRSFKRVSSYVEDAFLIEGIPVSVDAESEYFYRSEINTVISALQVILNSQDDLCMLTLLRSPIYKFSSEDIARIRMGCGHENLYTSMCRYATDNSDATAKKAAQILEDITTWKELEKIYTISELIWYLYESTNFYEMSALMSDGKMKQANLRTLFEKAHGFEREKFATLSGFVDYINNLKEADLSFVDAGSDTEVSDAVRVMSIHKSKGLEFPIVLIMNCEKQFNETDLTQKLVVQNDFGLGVVGSDAIKGIKWETPLRVAIKRKLQFELYSEEMRILYVAMTRAKEKLIMSGCVAKTDNYFSRIKADVEGCLLDSDVLLSQTIMSYKSYLSWVCCALFFKDAVKVNNIIKNLLSGEKSSDKLDDIWALYYYDSTHADIDAIEASDELQVPSDRESKLMSFVAQSHCVDDNSPQYIDLADNLSWKYEIPSGVSSRVKVSVSELVREFDTLAISEDTESFITESQDVVIPLYSTHAADNLVVPSFIGEKQKNRSIQRGLAYHTLVEHMDYLAAKDNEDYFERLKTQMVEKDLLSEEDAFLADDLCLKRFTQTDLYKRISNVYASSGVCFRERPFLIEFLDDTVTEKMLEEAEGINEIACAHLKGKNGVFIQGVIDMFFVEDGEIVLVDFKTNTVKDGEEQLRKKYEIQFLLYKYALERVTGLKVKEGNMYLLTYSGTEIHDNCIRMF